VVANMELEGMLLDPEAWRKLTVKRKEELIDLENSIKETIFYKLKLEDFETLYDLIDRFKLASDKVGYNIKTKRDTTLLQSIKDKECFKDAFYNVFNIGSSTQLKLLLNYLGYKLESTNEKYLANFKKDEIIEVILKYRETDKLISTYGDNFLENIHPVTKRIHTSFNSVGTKTGRFSSDGPNLQNITKAEGYRECFPAPEGYYFLDADYSQMEFREAGAVSGDKVIIDAYKQGKDMHTATALIVYGTEKERFKGKTINFSMIYGTSDYGMAYNMNIPIDEAKKILTAFWEGYSGLKSFKELVENKIWRNKFSSTLLGRKCYFEDRTGFTDIKEYNRYKTKILREGFSVLIQGTCAEIIKLAMLRIANENPFGDGLKMVLQVHDELGFYVRKEILEQAKEFVDRIMKEEEQKFLGDLPAATSMIHDICWKH
jgi:DNA polymerase I-like protein with 3'-5' exonuclease and polymerase domains